MTFFFVLKCKIFILFTSHFVFYTKYVKLIAYSFPKCLDATNFVSPSNGQGPPVNNYIHEAAYWRARTAGTVYIHSDHYFCIYNKSPNMLLKNIPADHGILIRWISCNGIPEVTSHAIVLRTRIQIDISNERTNE